MHVYGQAKHRAYGRHARRFRSQSAMEYLMTYGWAILIIAVILAAFFELGVFNPYTFAAKAQPGSCYVYRPDGAGTNNFISLQGTCNGEIPETVASMSGQNIFPITIGVKNYTYLPNGTDALSIFAWVKINSSDTSGWQRVVSYGTESCNGTSRALEINGAGVTGSVTYDSECGPSTWTNGLNVNNGAWHFIGFTIPDGGYSQNTILYYGGLSYSNAGTNTGSSSVNRQYIIIGGGPGSSAINGNIANVQIYNTALSQGNVAALYKEGIGGVPIDLNNLVGWWPLNGNANDYSGNGNNGNAINVSFTGGWYKGYTVP